MMPAYLVCLNRLKVEGRNTQKADSSRRYLFAEWGYGEGFMKSIKENK